MNRLTYGSMALVAMIAGSAFAADMIAVPPLASAPLPPAPVVENWTGSYIGANLGYGWGRPTWGTTANPAISFSDPAGVLGFAPYAAAGGFQFATLQPSGIVGGGQIGYDWQSGNWLLGAFADFQGVGMTASRTAIIPPVGAFFASTQSLTARESWLGTVRARVGYLATPNFLIYASGGLAYGQVNSRLNFGFPVPAVTSFIGSQTATRLGFAVGVGLEYRMAAHWTVALDAFHFDLGNASVTGLETATATGLPAGIPGASLTVTRRFTGDVLRGSINYRL